MLCVYFYRLNLRGQVELYASGFCMDDECWRLYEQKVHGILSQGLTDRAKFIRVSWRNTEPGCTIENVWAIYIYLVFYVYIYYSLIKYSNCPCDVRDYQYLIRSHCLLEFQLALWKKLFVWSILVLMLITKKM